MDVDERISVRFEKHEVKAMDNAASQLGLNNRSEFIRSAIRSKISAQAQRNAVQVEVSALLLEFIDSLVDRKYFKSREHALLTAVEGYFNEENIEKARRAAESMEVTVGKKLDPEMDGPRQTLSK
jgi:metal-responsive CopG/Arc/MetJ family transcriptional regulator